MINKALKISYMITLFILCLLIMSLSLYALESGIEGYTWLKLLCAFWVGVAIVTKLHLFDILLTITNKPSQKK